MAGRFLRSRKQRALLFLEYNGQCYYCGCNLKPSWHSDHFKPYSRGGETVMENMRPSCIPCNLKKGNKMIEPVQNRTSADYENMPHFGNDFNLSNGIRDCQKAAYNAIVDRLLNLKELSCSCFLPTGTGKSDLVRLIAEGLVAKRNAYAGVWVFEPSTDLRKQVVSDNVPGFYKRTGITRQYVPFMEIDGLDNERFRNGCVLESFTTQFLTTNGNVSVFNKAAKHIQAKTGKLPLAVFDESHLFSTDNQWGAAARTMQSIGIPIVLITGTPFRSDNIEIPGFRSTLFEQGERRFIKTRHTNDPMVIAVERGREKFCKYRLNADYEYSYSRAWQDGVILKPQPKFMDATEKTYDAILSSMSRHRSERLLRSYLMDESTIREAVKCCVASIRVRKHTNRTCAALVTTLSDEDEDELNVANDGNFDSGDIHAKKIEREFSRQAPDLKVLVVTSKTNAEDGLARFKRGGYDVLIVKAMGTIGFNYPAIKTVCNLSNFRTLPAYLQLAMRGCRCFEDMIHFDMIMPKDKGMIELWNSFMHETGLVIEKTEKIEVEKVDEKQKDIDGEPSVEQKPEFDNHNVSFDPISKRSRSEEIVELFDRKQPTLASKLSTQDKLTQYESIAKIHGPDWLEKLSDDVATPRMIDCNEEELRLRSEGNDIVREITNEVRLATGKAYSGELYGSIKKCVWTVLKRKCGFSPNQSLEQLSGIDNYKRLIHVGHILNKYVQMLPEANDVDYRRWLQKF